MSADNNNGQNKKVPFKKQTLTRGKRKNYRRRKLSNSGIAVILCAVLFASVLVASSPFLIKNAKKQYRKTKDAVEEIFSGTDEASGSETGSGDTPEEEYYDYISVPSSDVSRGSLILVNYETKYVFPETEDHLVNIFANKTDKYAVAYNNYVLDGDVLEKFNGLIDELYEVTGDTCILVNSTYRSLEEQQSIYDSYVQSNGEEYAKAYVADPGCSEHHTGLALDLTVRYADGTYVLMKNYENLSVFHSLAVKHGFVQRYPENKFNFTRINTEPWHYRYVGVPHSNVMSKRNFCLEEYVTFIKDYTIDGQMLFVGADGDVFVCDPENIPSVGYLLYYVPVSSEAETAVPVPKNAVSYTISGNNCGGFVVAVKFGEFTLPGSDIPSVG